jgi:hypothetical protein
MATSLVAAETMKLEIGWDLSALGYLRYSPLSREKKRAGYFFIERPTARILEAIRAANSMRTNQRAVFVVMK